MGDQIVRFEVRLEGAWVPYTRQSAQELGGELTDLHDAVLGEQEFPDMWRDADDIAETELDQSLDLIVGVHPDVEGVRVVVWEDTGTDAEPVAVRSASTADLAVGRLRYASRGVRQAECELQEARGRLRAQALMSAHRDGFGRNEIAREVEDTWSRRLVLAFLAGFDLVMDIQRLLPHEWPRRSGDPVDGLQPWETSLGPYWCGDVQLDLMSSGQVYLFVTDSVEQPVDAEGNTPYPDSPEMREHERGVQERTRALAELVFPILRTSHLRLLTMQGEGAGIDDLARRGVCVERPSRNRPLSPVVRPVPAAAYPPPEIDQTDQHQDD